jgi:hypothetical protein
MSQSKTCTVYWSPAFVSPVDWNMLYYNPQSLFDQVRLSKIESENNQNFIYCPAFGNFAKNTFLLKNPITSKFDITDTYELKSKSKNFISSYTREPTLEGCTLFKYGLTWIFFTEDDIEMTMTSPYFEKVSHLQYGNLVPGKVNISKWFRNINLEYNLHKGVNEFCVEKDETLAYLNFNTDKQVKLVRFEMTEKLYKIMHSVGTSSDWESWIPLVSRYKRFMETQTNKIVLNEIKRNLVDTDTE